MRSCQLMSLGGIGKVCRVLESFKGAQIQCGVETDPEEDSTRIGIERQGLFRSGDSQKLKSSTKARLHFYGQCAVHCAQGSAHGNSGHTVCRIRG